MIMLQICGVDFDKKIKREGLILFDQINFHLECKYCQILNETFKYMNCYSVFTGERFSFI